MLGWVAAGDVTAILQYVMWMSCKKWAYGKRNDKKIVLSKELNIIYLMEISLIINKSGLDALPLFIIIIMNNNFLITTMDWDYFYLLIVLSLLCKYFIP